LSFWNWFNANAVARTLVASMQCDHCHVNEATVHELTVVNGVKHERHICEACARELNLGPGGPGLPGLPGSPAIVPKLIGSLTNQAPGTAEPEAQTPTRQSAEPRLANVCPQCKTTFAEFKQLGLLGCPTCYTTFESQLIGLLERAHEGLAQHMGKTPRRATGQPAPAVDELAERAERVKIIRKQLDEAIRAEQYERAARLRDQLKSITPEPGRG